MLKLLYIGCSDLNKLWFPFACEIFSDKMEIFVMKRAGSGV